MSAGRDRWLSAGSPVHGIAYPVADFTATLRGHGYTVGTIGNDAHMLAPVAEDHTWYSETGWPVASPLGWEFACDVMPGGPVDLARLGAQIAHDRDSGLPAASWIKYMNYSPPGAGCRHESWEPGHAITGSSDVGHIHISCRSDVVSSRVAVGYDPVATILGGGPPAPAPAPAPTPAGQAPPFPGRVLVDQAPMMHGTDVHAVQQRLHDRTWTITVDGWYGNQSRDIITAFQRDSTAHGWPLAGDGKVGPLTWRALWLRPRS